MIIDLHSHLIPGIDDGAQNLEDAIELAKLGEAEGVTHLVLTPHHRNGQYINKRQDVLRFTHALKQEFQKANIKMELFSGQEIRISEHFVEDYYNNELLSLDAKGTYYLIEFPTRKLPDDAMKIIGEMIELGVTPVIAHPERNHAFAADFDLLFTYIEMGCLAQVTSSSYVGYYGEKLRQISKEMIKRNLVHIIASDVHHIEHRPFNMQLAFEMMEKDFGIEMVDYFQQNARNIINGKTFQIKPAQGKRIKKKRTKRFFGLF